MEASELSGLFVRAGRGDATAQARIVDLIRDLSRAACARGGTATSDLDWEDVAQDACRRFFEGGLDRFRRPGAEKGYLLTIVRSALVQTVRSEVRRRRREESTRGDDVALPHDPIPRVAVSSILESLPVDCRELLTRVFLRGESYATLAREDGILASSVRTRVTRCLRRAREFLAEGERS